MKEATEEPTDKEIRDEILRQLMSMNSGASICPSDVARSLRQQWRQWMPMIREVASEMARDNEIAVTQQGQPIEIETATGPVRLALKLPKQNYTD
jgi:hypothetical protein